MIGPDRQSAPRSPMKRVSVIATFHAEVGLVTAAALEAIVSRLEPDVVFLECPPEALERYLHGDIDSPESVVARQFDAEGRVALVPVDLPTPDASFFWEHEKLIGRVERRNRDFRNLSDLQRHNVRAYGFPYLNSDASDTLLTMIEEETRAAVEMYADPVLNEAHALWNRHKQDREDGMMQAIESYCAQHGVCRGAFMIGAAHRKALMESAKSRADASQGVPRWDFAVVAGPLDGAA